MALSKITTGSLADAAITTDKIANSAINSAKIGVDVITAEDLAANSITVAEITNGAVTPAKLSTGGLYWDASSNVGIGTSTIGSAGVSLNNEYNIGWAQSAGESVPNIFRQASSAATVVANGYRYTATSNGFASSFSSSFAKSAISVGDGSVRFYTDTAATTAAGTDVTPTERLRIDSDGLKFNGDTAAANALDDYEEGTFTCTIGYNTSITSATSANATTTVIASYIKIGKMVQVNFPYIERATTFGGTSVVVFYMTVPFTCGPSNGPGVLLAHYNLSARYTTSVFSTWIPYAQVDVGTNQMRLGSGTYNQTGGGYISLEHSASGMNLGCVYIASA